MKSLSELSDNIGKIAKLLYEAKDRGTDIAVLPEMCCCPYENTVEKIRQELSLLCYRRKDLY